MTQLAQTSRKALEILDEPLRSKAIEIAQAIVKAGYDERAAVPVAVEHARRWLARRARAAA